jgi:hypothetical protein
MQDGRNTAVIRHFLIANQYLGEKQTVGWLFNGSFKAAYSKQYGEM